MATSSQALPQFWSPYPICKAKKGSQKLDVGPKTYRLAVKPPGWKAVISLQNRPHRSASCTPGVCSCACSCCCAQAPIVSMQWLKTCQSVNLLLCLLLLLWHSHRDSAVVAEQSKSTPIRSCVCHLRASPVDSARGCLPLLLCLALCSVLKVPEFTGWALKVHLRHACAASLQCGRSVLQPMCHPCVLHPDLFGSQWQQEKKQSGPHLQWQQEKHQSRPHLLQLVCHPRVLCCGLLGSQRQQEIQ